MVCGGGGGVNGECDKGRNRNKPYMSSEVRLRLCCMTER